MLSAWVLWVGGAGCSGGGAASSPCEGVVCGPGRCVEPDGRAACECEPDHHAEGLTCVADLAPPRDPCTLNPCQQPGRTQCANVEGKAVCGCDPGLEPQPDGACVKPNACEPNPCTTPNKTDCTVSNGQAVCACVSGYVPEGDACQPEPAVTCAAQHTTGDAFEPDECPALARPVGAGGTRDEAHSLSPAGDEDWFRLDALPEHFYEVVVTGAAGDRLHLDLYAADGTTVVRSDHRGLDTASLRHKASASGALFVRVSAMTSGASAAYRISIQDLGADDHGESPAESSPVIVDAPPASGAFERPGDVDVFSFQAQAGHIYAFTCNPMGGAKDCFVSLSNAAGDLLAADTNGGTGFIAYEYTVAGTYFFRLNSDQVGGYTYRLEDQGFDDHGDTRATASAVTPAATSNAARLEVDGDVDFLSFSAEAGRFYSITCASSAFVCGVELQDAAGAVLASGSASPGAPVTLTHSFATAGTAYVRLASTSAGAFGAYAWKLETGFVDDHGDTLEQATPITPDSASHNATWERSGDVDLLAFNALAGHIYEVTCDRAAPGCDLRLLDTDGALLASDSGTHARLVHELSAAGKYHVRLAGVSGTTGAYTYRVVDLGLDDHGNTAATATPLVVGAPAVNGRFDTATDVDVFSFGASAGHVYDIDCTSSTLSCDLRLLDAAGGELASQRGANARVLIELASAGTYYVRLASGSTAAGTYSVRVVDLGTDDHGDTPATATALMPSATPATGRVETVGDVDVFSFSGAVNTVYEFSCSSSAIDCNAVLTDASGTVLKSDTSSSPSAKVTYLVRSAGTFFVKVSSGTATVGDYTYQLKNLGTDDHGNSPGDATPVTPSTTLASARIDDAQDVDVFSFSAVAGHIYEVECNTTAFNCDLVLLDATGTQIAADTSSATSARVRAELNTAGTYYFRVQPGSTAFGAYSYRVQDLGVDDHGNTAATATPIVPATSSTAAKFEVRGDEDWFSFSAEAGHIYDFSCISPSLYCGVYLVDSAGTVLKSDPATNKFAGVRYEFNTGGTYYYRVTSASWDSSLNYSFQLKDIGVDDHGDTAATATPIVPSTSFTAAKFEVSGDEDWFSFTAQAGHIYEFSCSSPSLYCGVSLVDSAGTTVKSVPATSKSASVRYEFNTGGLYYYRVPSAFWDSSMSYSFRLQDLGVDDHGDTAATATPIVSATSSTAAKFEVNGDEDWFSFTAETGHIYDFSCSSPSLYCGVYLVNSAGTVLKSVAATSKSASVRYEFDTGGTYYYRVTSAFWDSSMNYSFRLQDLGVDDHADTFTGATVLTLGTAASGTIEVSGDPDFFAVTLAAGTSYTVTTTGSSITATVYAPDKTTVITSGSGARAFTSSAAGGTHYVRVLSSSVGAYTVKVQ